MAMWVNINNMNVREDFELLADKKKFRKVTSDEASQSTVALVKDAIQILESKSMASPLVKTNPQAFKDFLVRNIPEIIRCFEKTLSE
jgi:hypothetical protein